MSKSSRGNSEYPGGTFSGGRRTAAKGNREEADPLMPKWKGASTKKSSTGTYKPKSKSGSTP